MVKQKKHHYRELLFVPFVVMTTPIATQGFFDPTKLLSLCQDRFEEKGGGETALLLGYGGHVNIQLQNVEEYAATIIDSPLLLNKEEKTGKEDNSTTKDAIDDDGGDTNDSIRSGVIQMAWHSINYSYYPDEVSFRSQPPQKGTIL